MAEGGTTDFDALRIEAIDAFCRRKRKKLKAHMRDIEWMYEHCTSPNSELFQLYGGDRSNLTLFDIQTYRQWRSHIGYERVVHFRRLRKRAIVIQPLVLSSSVQESAGYKDTEIHQRVLELLCYYCESFFTGMSVRIAPPIDIGTIKKLTKRVHKKTLREQYLVGDLLKYLQSVCPRDAFSIVGVTIVDIYPGPEWNFVLGQASLTTGCGVFSFGRFFKSKLQVDRRMAESCQLKEMWILIRVMTHELCHIFGIKHCYYFQCSLNDSSSISEAATQPLFTCPVCLKKLRKSLQFNTLERYRTLLEATRVVQSAVVEALQVWAERKGAVITTLDVERGEDEAKPGLEHDLTEVPAEHGRDMPASFDVGEISPESADEGCSDNETELMKFNTDGVSEGQMLRDPSMASLPALLSQLANQIVPLSQSTNQTASLSQLANQISPLSQSTSEVAYPQLLPHPSVSSLPKELWHVEQLEYFSRAISWLERAVEDLERFDRNWSERKMVTTGWSWFQDIVFPGLL